MREQPYRIVVVGDGLAAATTAAVLGQSTPRTACEIVQVTAASNDPEDEAWVLATQSGIRRFHANLGIDESRLMGATGGTFTLGVAYSGWSRRKPAFFVPYGDVGAALAGVPFIQQALRLREHGHDVRFADYSLATIMAQAGRFARPSDDARSPLSTYSYGLHLQRSAYCAYLRGIAESQGVPQITAELADVRLDPHGAIAGLALNDGRSIEADLFVDATGPQARLISRLGGDDFCGLAPALPYDRLAHVLSSAAPFPPPYSHVAAHPAGWAREVPVRGQAGQVLAFSSGETSDDEAVAGLLDSLAVKTPSQVSVSPVSAGYRSPWNRNCVAIGGACAVLDPGSPLALDLIQTAAERLVDLVPAASPLELSRREFNRLTNQQVHRAADFTISRFKLNGRQGEPLWDAARSAPISDALAYRIELFRSRGRVVLGDGDDLEEADWAIMLDELGVCTERHDLAADAAPIEQLAGQFAKLRQLLISAAASAPVHGSYLSSTQGVAA